MQQQILPGKAWTWTIPITAHRPKLNISFKNLTTQLRQLIVYTSATISHNYWLLNITHYCFKYSDKIRNKGRTSKSKEVKLKFIYMKYEHVLKRFPLEDK